jgi:hypothetical protein
MRTTIFYDRICNQIKVVRTTHAPQSEFNKIILFNPEESLLDIGINNIIKNLIILDLEDNFRIKISGVDREEIISVQDLLTAIFLQKTKNI